MEAIKQRDLALQKANEVDKLVVEGSETTKRQIYAKNDNLVVKYNANILKFRNLSWFDNDYPKALALVWEAVVAEERGS